MIKKGKYEGEMKTCKNCGKEFSERENFNWSCRVHRSDWGGEVWWCCGKRGFEQAGCKFSKHEVKIEGAEILKESGATREELERLKLLQKVKCRCCNEVGHITEDCTRDPNIKTNKPVANEEDRISKIKDFRKLQAETNLQTLQLIKKSVIVPKVKGKQHPFKRGIMNFDDFNYEQFNQYVLVEEPPKG